MSSVTQPLPLLTAEEFGQRPDPGHPEELVRGRIVSMPPTARRHGQVCSKVDRIVGNFAEAHDLGHVLSNDSGVITERGPDSVRGPDIAYYSYDRLPRGVIAPGYGPEVPDLVFEVLSPSDRWPKVLAKVAEYLNAGVSVVCIIDPERSNLHLYEGENPVQILAADDELALPDLLPGFRVTVRRFFE